ncbi:Glutaryl-7-aminocephalosporanic-acid acylase precursor [Tsuneonella dongtanensis]|uniref:Glutaryl-7-aminocephalosporanic-acid acylase n=1 Tax=Tsuneonella dongtanensis TaxID=692370 RepID=A0A1B2AGR7_9SPHN|nr:acylase [Tsuneonella dongtanensis]ANY21334.1 Glutaryl-7-aminocephalosporanic-acid acylase precursor [Tsuneonella dongtanensis]
MDARRKTRSKWLGILAAIFGVALIAVLAGLLVWEPFAASPGAPPPARAYRAEIVRDEWGVPHVYGKTDADVAYGVARAHAEDDFFTLQDVVAMTRGRYGAIKGEEGAMFDYVLALLDARGTAQREYAKLAPRTRAVLEAYATGLNDHAAAHPGEVKLGNLFPVNGEDIATGFALRQPFFFGLNGTIGPLAKGDTLLPDPGPKLRGPLPDREGAENLGSNAFAIAPGRSGDGVTRLVSNSHQPFWGGVAWYELVVESDEGWHFAGATFPGSPFPFLGHNRDLGWTNTVNQPDMIDVYKLVLDDSGENYRLDGKWLPLERSTVRLPVRLGPLVLPVGREVLRSAHGPVVQNGHGTFAFRYGGMGSLATLDAYYDINKARTYEEWQAILARQAIPSTNFIYADKTGTIAYWYNASIPQRQKGIDWRGILPGDRSDLIWNALVPFESLPNHVNPASGFVFNANNTPFVAAGKASDLSPDSVPPEMGVELRMTNRAYRAAKLLDEPGPIDRARLEAIKYDTGWERQGYVKRVLDGIAALDTRGDPLLAEGQRLLAGWDMTSDGAGRADALALLVMRPAMGEDYSGKPLTPARKLLRDAATHLETHFGRLDPPLQTVLRLRQGPGPHAIDLPLDGGSDTLRASTLWDVEPDGRLKVKHGDSFIQFVEWAPGKRVVSQSIQPFGAATTRPRSVHYSDQAALFVQHKLKPVHFMRADVLKNAVSRKVVTHRLRPG